jgi:16S rRNA processing protein RimM
MVSPDDLRVVGVVAGVHGLQGTVKLEPLSDFPERFEALKTVYVVRNNEILGTYAVKRVRWAAAHVLLTLKGLTTREDAEAIRGAEVCVHERETWPLPENVYYVSDLAGFTAIEQSGKRVGTLKDILMGANDILVIELDGGGELLVPFVGEWVGRVDTIARTVEVIQWRDLTDAESVESAPEDDDH